MSGAIPPLPQCAFMAWCSVKSTGTILPFTLPLPTLSSNTSWVYSRHLQITFSLVKHVNSLDMKKRISWYITLQQLTVINLFHVAFVGNTQKLRRVDANIQNKQSRTPNKGWSYGLGVGSRTNISLLRKCYQMLHRASDLNEFFGTSLNNNKKKWTSDLEHGMTGVSIGQSH
jgi:hypothetical protein